MLKDHVHFNSDAQLNQVQTNQLTYQVQKHLTTGIY